MRMAAHSVYRAALSAEPARSDECRLRFADHEPRSQSVAVDLRLRRGTVLCRLCAVSAPVESDPRTHRNEALDFCHSCRLGRDIGGECAHFQCGELLWTALLFGRR